MANYTTPEGNIYPVEGTAITPEVLEEIARNRDALDMSTKATAQKALDTANGYSALINTARTDASTAISTANDAKSTADGIAGTANTALATANSSVANATEAKVDADNAVARVENLETLGGVAPGDTSDATVALHINQPDSQARTALNAAIDEKAGSLSSVPQIDYVGTLARMAGYDSMTVTKLDADGRLEVKCSAPSGGYVRYQVTSAARYQYVADVHALAPGAAAVEYVTTAEYGTAAVTATNFTWSGLATTPYTAQVGAVWTQQITTTTSNAKVQFASFRDNRGGIWRISVVGTSITKDHSTWNDAGMTAALADLFTIPEPGTYTIRGEFIGQDPANPTATPRGWGQNTTGSVPVRMLAISEPVPAPQQVSPVSNKDFAIRVGPAGSTQAATEYIPYHGTASEAFASATKYYNAGAPLDVAAMTVGQAVPVDSFEWSQHIYGRNSSSGTTNLLEVWTTQKITPDGVYSVTGRWKTLVPIVTGAYVYHLMLMGSLPLFDEAVSALGTSYTLDGSTAPANIWTEDGNRTDGWALLSSTSDAVAAVRYDNRRETLRAGQEGTQTPDKQTFIELRTGGNMAKVYANAYTVAVDIPAGRNHRFAGAYFYGTAPGARNALSLA